MRVSQKKKVLIIVGTRPEAIKLAPLIMAFRKRDDFDTIVCSTGQHRHMLDQVLSFFHIEVDYDLNLMKQNQSLFDITSDGIKGLEQVLKQSGPEIVFVQGDTTTALIGALGGYYTKAKVAHIEAGLRSGDRYSPYPEEMNRILVSRLSDYHFAPTVGAKNNLEEEGIHENVWVVGNTVIDALLLASSVTDQMDQAAFRNYFGMIDFGKRIVLVTGHRRESFGDPFEQICHALLDIVRKFDDVEVVYPMHMNPNVREPVNRILGGEKRIHLIEPLEYPFLIWLMKKSFIVLTDSGGIQEEAPSLGKPVVVLRDVTERMEGVVTGTAVLAGTRHEKIVEISSLLLTDKGEYARMSKAANPYGDGRACERIVNLISMQ